MLSEPSDLAQQLRAFENGAVEVLHKPIAMDLLWAKIQVHLKFEKKNIEPVVSQGIYNLKLDLTNKCAYLSETKLELNLSEFELLEVLVAQYGKNVSREYFFAEKMGRPYDGKSRGMDCRATKLRKKLRQADSAWEIKADWTNGYFLVYSGQDNNQWIS